jgi:hypothetical protein
VAVVGAVDAAMALSDTPTSAPRAAGSDDGGELGEHAAALTKDPTHSMKARHSFIEEIRSWDWSLAGRKKATREAARQVSLWRERRRSTDW